MRSAADAPVAALLGSSNRFMERICDPRPGVGGWYLKTGRFMVNMYRPAPFLAESWHLMDFGVLNSTQVMSPKFSGLVKTSVSEHQN